MLVLILTIDRVLQVSSWDLVEHLIALAEFDEICTIPRNLMAFHPSFYRLKALASMLGIKVHERANFLNPPLTKDAGVKRAHQLLTEDVYAVT